MNLLFYFIIITTIIIVNSQNSCRHPFSSTKSVLHVKYTYWSSSRHLESVKEVNRYENQELNCEQWLYLNGNEFEEIRNDVFNNLPVDGLEINGQNEIVFNERSFTGLNKLQSLNIYITPKLYTSDTKKWIDVYEKIKNITHLTYPFTDDDHIKEILPIFKKLKSLVMIKTPYSIYSNSFQGASKTITKLKILTNNPMRINYQAFSALSGLTDLIFENTQINYLEFDGPFDGLNNLKNLNIWFEASSKTKNITRNTFKGLNKLETLTIRKDDVIEYFSLDSFIDVDTFSGLKLKTLDLSNFYIGQLRMGIFNGLSVENLYVKPKYTAHVKELAFFGIKITNLHIIDTELTNNTYFKAYYSIPETANVFFE